MSAPQPPGGDAAGAAGAGGEAAMRPEETRAFAGRVDALEQGVAEAQAALDRLAAETLPVGSGEDNAAIAAWYRELVTTDTVPAARSLAGELEALKSAVRQSAALWEQTDAGGARPLGQEPGPA
jgi:uncharacterized protein YukE